MDVSHRLKFLIIVISGFFISLTGCTMPVEEQVSDSDESVEIDEQIGEAEQAVTWADQLWWKGLTQIGRNSAILLRASQDMNKNVGMNCKMWGSKVVSDASKGVVTLPTTTNNSLGWTWNSSPYVQQMGTISFAAPGNIVQMNLGANSPHTAIVWSNDGLNICWIDSNYVGPYKVGTHCQTIGAFLNSVTVNGSPKYTVYQITGG